MAELCREFGVSRKTGYKWIQRFIDGGMPNLVDRARTAHRLKHAVPPNTIERVLEARRQFGWGPKKLKEVLEREHPDVTWPALSTIAAILAKHGLTHEKKRRQRTPQSTVPFAAATAPNIVWCTDFKGKFRVARRYCHPLTITDACSRYILGCEPLEGERIVLTKEVFARVFREHGLPLRIRSDNGTPFASCGIGGLSVLSVWWVKLGILPERIEPGKPQQNGRHERMHRTLKYDTASPPASDWEAQCQALQTWREQFNNVRPHEALDMKTPASCYQNSPRPYPSQVGDPEYPSHFEVRRAKKTGAISVHDFSVSLGSVLQAECIGLEPTDDGVWHLWFGPVFLGKLRELGRRKFQMDKEVNPMT